MDTKNGNQSTPQNLDAVRPSCPANVCARARPSGSLGSRWQALPILAVAATLGASIGACCGVAFLVEHWLTGGLGGEYRLAFDGRLGHIHSGSATAPPFAALPAKSNDISQSAT